MELKNKKNRIIVTGADGFIGRVLVQELQKNKSFEVFGVDIERNIDNKTNNFMKMDFCDISESFLSTCDYVFHLAAVVGVDKCQNQPEQLKLTNLSNTKKFLSKCAQCNIKKIIFTSSSEVYGNSTQIPYREDDEPEPFSLYGKYKRDVENFLYKLHQDNPAVQIIIPRFFNVYGPFQRKDFVINNFVKNALKDKDLEVFGDGTQTRSFTYVEDVVRVLISMLDYSASNYEIFNIGSKYEYPIKKIAETVISLTPNSTSRIIFKEYGNNGIRTKDLDVVRRVPSIEKARKKLKFEASISPEEGIKKVIYHHA